MAYVLKGRVVRDDRLKSPCIFCGRKISHFNEGGTGMFLNALHKGKSRTFSYCHEDVCPQRTADETYENSLWCCGCVSDYIEVVGPFCPNCQRPRHDPTPVNDEKVKLVYVRNLQVYSRENMDAFMERFREDMDAMLVGKTRLTTLGTESFVAQARHYGVENDWYDDLEEEDGDEEQD